MTDKKPLFSVVITAYNKGKYIKSTLESVLNQSIQDFEVIVIDDGSTDDTKRKVLSIKDKRIRYFYQKASGLPACARNRGIKHSSGRFIALLDGDDIWHSEKLEKNFDVFSKHPKTDITCHDIEITGESFNFVRHISSGPYPTDIYSKLLWEDNCLGISMAVLKKEIFFKHNFWFDEDKRLFGVEDYDFWFRLAETKKYNFYYIPEVLAKHIVSQKGVVLANVERFTRNLLYLFDKNIEKSKHDITSERKKLVKKRRSSMMRSAALSYNYNGDFIASSKWFLRAIKEYPFNTKSYAGMVLSLLRVRMRKI